MQQQQFEKPWESHGRLVLSENKHFLEYEDGTDFFWLGDTAWRLSLLNPDDLDRYLQNRVEKGFNVIQFVITGMVKSNYRGDRPVTGEGTPWDKVELNEPFWEYMDHIIERIGSYGMYACPFLWWGPCADDSDCMQEDNRFQFFKNPYEQNYEFGKILAQRYRTSPHLIWVGAGEYQTRSASMFRNGQKLMSESRAKHLLQAVKGIKDGDEGNHLFTIHPLSFYSSSDDYHTEDWLDFNMVQTHAVPATIERLMLSDWNLEPVKPTINAEAWYEKENGLYTRWTTLKSADDSFPEPGWKQRYQAYWSVFFGGFGFTYGHKNIWKMEDEEENPGVLKDEIMNAPGCRDLIHLKNLMLSRPITSREPAPFLLSPASQSTSEGLKPNLRCATCDVKRTWAYIYTSRGSAFKVYMRKLAERTMKASWFNPRDGEYSEPFLTGIPSGPGAADLFVKGPSKVADGNDWVLVLELE